MSATRCPNCASPNASMARLFTATIIRCQECGFYKGGTGKNDSPGRQITEEERAANLAKPDAEVYL